MLHMTIFGESHGSCVGIVLEGVTPGLELDTEFVKSEMSRRRPGKNELSTKRDEPDEPELLSGVYEGRATGAPLCAVIKNQDTRSGDYERMRGLARPGHADYTGFVRFHGFNDYRGGGHFSGRLTAPMVFAGAVAKLELKRLGVAVGSHIRELAGITDRTLDPAGITQEELEGLRLKEFPVLDDECGLLMQREIIKAAGVMDSVGGVIECAAVNIPAGIGQPGMDSLEGIIARYAFAVPAVKGIEFGAGFGFKSMRGSEANDSFYMKGGAVRTKTNNNGGINGGITNGMPVVFSVCVKPTPSIGVEQDTIDFIKRENAKIAVGGRHDPCIVQRAVPVIEAAAALALCEAFGDGSREESI